jgi:hypothetical protein
MIRPFRGFSAHRVGIVRIGVIAFGAAAIAWGTAVFPALWRDASMEHVARRVAFGDPFKVEVLASQLPVVEAAEKSSYCRPAGIRGAAVIRTRLAELALATNDRGLIDSGIETARQSIRTALSCSPADPFLWMSLYWVESVRSDAQPDVRYLRMSYQLGQNEGWIALARNGIAFARFGELPPDLANDAIHEFVGLLEIGEYDTAVRIFTGPAWPARETILPRLADVSIEHRRAFATAVYAAGYDIAVPGVARPDPEMPDLLRALRRLYP